MELQLVYVGAAFPGIPCKAEPGVLPLLELHVVHKHRHTQWGGGGIPISLFGFYLLNEKYL